jgi:arsenate reductase
MDTGKNKNQEAIMQKVLFICIHNSARSQMAEAYLNKFGGDKFSAESAGLEPGVLNPLVVKVMAEDGIDISGNKTKSVFDFYKQGKLFSYVVAVCDAQAAERCPIFPGTGKKLHWPFNDPSKAEGTEEEKMGKIRDIRDSIKSEVIKFIKDYSE